MLCETRVFASSGICGSSNAFWCVPGAKHRCTLFHARVYGFRKKCAETCYAELVFLHPVGSICHIVLSGASGS
jgi:hypothetical protein